MAVIAAALTALGATTALAVGPNVYSTEMKFSPRTVGTSSHPSPLRIEQVFKIRGTSGNRPAPIERLRSVMYGLSSDGKDFPKCSAARITSARSDTACPKGALVASGNIHALIGPIADPSASSSKVVLCDALLHAWNGGQGRVVFFLITDPRPTGTHYCGGISTGAIAPYQGTIRTSGRNLILDVTMPPDFSTSAAGVGGYATSVLLEDLIWGRLTIKSRGRTRAYLASVACDHGKRPWSQSYSASSVSAAQAVTQTGSPRC